MPLTAPDTAPEIRQAAKQGFGRAFLGYRRAEVNQYINMVADRFELVWRERADLAERLDDLEVEATKHKELEALLRSTLVSAERAAQDMKEQARRESDLIVQEAHAEGRRVTREAAAEKRRLEEAMRTIRAQLRAALESLEESPKEGAPESAQPTPEKVEEITDSGIRKVAG